MTDTVTKRVLHDGPTWHVVHLTNASDGTGESAVVKVDRSALSGVDGKAVSRLSIEQVIYSIQGFDFVKLAFDHDNDDTALLLGPGDGEKDFADFASIADPGSAGGTGDLLLTTTGAASGASYSITLRIRKR